MIVIVIIFLTCVWVYTNYSMFKYEKFIEEQTGGNAFCSSERRGNIKEGIIIGAVTIPQDKIDNLERAEHFKRFIDTNSDCNLLLQYKIKYNRITRKITYVDFNLNYGWSEFCISQDEEKYACNIMRNW